MAQRLTKEEIELRKWALEMAIEHGNTLFSKDHYVGNDDRTIENRIREAKKIITLMTEDWIS